MQLQYIGLNKTGAFKFQAFLDFYQMYISI